MRYLIEKEELKKKLHENIDGVAQKGPILNFDKGPNRFHAFKRIR